MVNAGCSATPADEDYLLSYIDTTNDTYSYRDRDGEVIIPAGKYQICFTDTFRTYAIVLKSASGFVGIDREENELYRVFPFDNGPDDPSEGMFRIIENDLIGFADSTTGKVVIKPRYPCAFPFQDGVSKVSMNCKSATDGEHSTWAAEDWFYINKKGEKVGAPVTETAEDKLIIPDSLIRAAPPAITANIKRIDETANWQQVIKEELMESTEGGEANYYYNNDKLEKIVSRQYGETYQQWDAYYFVDEKLSFVLERHYQYNRPMYYDKAAMKAAKDSVAFDFDKSVITDQASYFENGNLVKTRFDADSGPIQGKRNLGAEMQRINLNLRTLMQYRNKLK